MLSDELNATSNQFFNHEGREERKEFVQFISSFAALRPFAFNSFVGAYGRTPSWAHGPYMLRRFFHAAS
jgi:hypothetical protein